jgi:hypothetical protein
MQGVSKRSLQILRALWRVLRKRSHLKAYKLSLFKVLPSAQFVIVFKLEAYCEILGYRAPLRREEEYGVLGSWPEMTLK